MTFRLDGKRCLVTGGGSGIGRGTVLSLLRAGARVAIIGRRLDPLRETAALAVDAGEVVPVVCDVRDSASVRAAVDQAATSLGGLDVLVNNAGVGGPNACSDAAGDDRWDEIVRTNLDGIFHCSREALRHIGEGGRIINISSVLGQFGVPGYTAYCASKHGVIGFTKALALEVAPKRITVNAVCPGWVDTVMAEDGMKDMAQGMGVSFDEARTIAMAGVPLGRILRPDEVGDLIVYLASDAASGMTAQALNLCGGQVMNG